MQVFASEWTGSNAAAGEEWLTYARKNWIASVLQMSMLGGEANQLLCAAIFV
jgi:hypothetical protein